MDPQRQEEIYSLLVRTWKNEVAQLGLAKISNKKQFISDCKRLVQYLKKQINDTPQLEIKLVYQRTIENIQYMLNDFLEVRTEKIMTAANCLQKLDETLLLPMEIPYYQALYTAFKGYSKTKRMIFEEIKLNGNSHSFADIPPECEDNPIIPQSPTIPDEILFTNDENKNQEKTIVSMDNPENKNKNENDATIILNQTSQNPTKDSQNLKSNIIDPKIKSLNYQTLRVLEKIPQIVGEDMKIYGPFDKEDIIHIPKKNAVILIEEKMAKTVDL